MFWVLNKDIIEQMDKKEVHYLKYLKCYRKISRNKEIQKENVKFWPITGTVPVQFLQAIRMHGGLKA